MPRTAGRVLRMINDADANAESMGRVIETDPALAGAVLRLINSALFSLSQPVSALPQAIVLLGFLRLRSLLLATVAAGLRDLIPPSAAESRDLIWDHSVSTGLGARALAERLGYSWYEEAFVGGLMHDCGRLVLLGQRPLDYQLLLAKSAGLPGPAAERASMGVDHTEVGAALFRYWNQAPQLIDVAASHHVDGPITGENAHLVAIVVLADHLLNPHADEDDAEFACGLLGIPTGDIRKLRIDIPRQVAEARSSLLSM
jgi:HD-like signal output (HDOD) protein